MVWENLPLSAAERASRRLASIAATAGVILLWTIPVAFVASLTTLQDLDNAVKGLNVLGGSTPFVSGFVQGFVPALVLLIFNAILPIIMRSLSHYEGHPTMPEISFAVLDKMFWFQVINVFLVSLIAGSLFDIADDLRLNFRGTLDLLGESIPRVGTFFTTLVMLRGELVWLEEGKIETEEVGQ